MPTARQCRAKFTGECKTRLQWCTREAGIAMRTNAKSLARCLRWYSTKAAQRIRAAHKPAAFSKAVRHAA